MLYTRKGDNGETKLFGCNQSLSKSSNIAEALGVLDEANSYLGVCHAYLQNRDDLKVSVGTKKKKIKNIVRDTQETLFVIQAEVAGAKKRVNRVKIKNIEKIIDSIEKEIPKIHTFSVPGETKLSAMFDVARTVSRRAERRVVAVNEENIQFIGKNTLAYLNRLSSLLFAIARYLNHIEGVSEKKPNY